VQALFDRIAADGPIPFDEFMRIALYEPREGYFASGPLRSARSGDFLTSPEVSPLFGATLGRFAAGEAERISVEPLDVVEVGAGTGSLLRPLLDHLEASSLPTRAAAVEVSPAARTILADRVPEAEIVGDVAEIGTGLHGVVVANELLDNLPAAVAVRRGVGWSERLVETDEDGFRFCEAPARASVAEWAERHSGEVAEGGLVEVQIEAAAWLRAAIERLTAGSVVVIDYGDTAEGLASRRAEGTVRTYRAHHLGPDPLTEPGRTDITMDVDFGALAATAVEAGASVTVSRQAEFLAEWGLGERLLELREREYALARSGDPIERLRVRDLRTGGETLLHPRGLGDFRVLVARVGKVRPDV
jgi:SAM-dependent MidA family methyltransferase